MGLFDWLFGSGVAEKKLAELLEHQYQCMESVGNHAIKVSDNYLTIYKSAMAQGDAKTAGLARGYMVDMLRELNRDIGYSRASVADEIPSGTLGSAYKKCEGKMRELEDKMREQVGKLEKVVSDSTVSTQA